jgi:hypothetical protein
MRLGKKVFEKYPLYAPGFIDFKAGKKYVLRPIFLMSCPTSSCLW